MLEALPLISADFPFDDRQFQYQRGSILHRVAFLILAEFPVALLQISDVESESYLRENALLRWKDSVALPFPAIVMLLPFSQESPAVALSEKTQARNKTGCSRHNVGRLFPGDLDSSRIRPD